MKNALGKLLILLVFSLLNAKDFDYNAQINKTQPYVKEAVILSFDVNQTNPDIVLLFDFDILKDPSYTAQRINIEEDEKYHNASIRYTYLIYALQAGEINIHFKLRQKATTDESVAYSFSGDRDNVKTLETKDSDIPIPPLKLHAKALPKGTTVVGDFTLATHIPTHTAQAHEPIPLQITIQGLGYPPLLPSLLPKETTYKQFIEKPKHKSTRSHKGTDNTVIYTMAVSHEQNFSIAPIRLHAFNPLLEKSYILEVKKQDFIVQNTSKDKLIDSINSPAPMQIPWQNIKTFLSYLLVFIFGYALAYFKVNRFLRSKKTSKKSLDKASLLKIKIIHASDHKALLQLLIAQKDYNFSSTIQNLEAVCYRDKNISLKTLKKDAEENIHA